MTDPLDDLKRVFERGTPEPDAERRRANLARATELFDQAQESAAEPRRIHDRLTTRAGIGLGVRHVLNALTSRPVLAAAGVLAAVGLAAVFVTVNRNAVPRQPVFVADAGIAPEPAVAPLSEGPEAGPTAAPTGEVPAATGDPRQAEAPAGESAARVASRRDRELAEDREAVEAVAAERDRQPRDRTVEPVDLPERPPTAPQRSTRVSQHTTTPDSFDSVIAGLERRREQLRVQLESLPGAGHDAADSALARETEEIVAADRRNVSSELVAEAEPPPPEPTGPLHARAERLRAGAMEPAALAAWSSADVVVPRQPNTEAFANEPASPIKVAAEEPVSTFSIDVDTASYSVVRSSLMNGYLPAPESVRIEELVNYFPYAYPPPGERGAPFRPTVTVAQTPWNPDTLLMHIGLQGREPAKNDRPPLNLVFLIDTSGSMAQPNKLPLLVQSFRLMVGQLDPADEVAIVTYAGSAGRVLEPTPSTERGTILAALDRLHAAGSTAGAAGIQVAYGTAAGMVADGEVTRVILATDGDFNVGISDPEQLEGFIARQRKNGIYLSVLGFGRGNLDDATMQALAQNGNGQAAYIDTLSEARKVLVDQLVGTLFPIADDVKIQVEFNPAAVAEYRLIGYETRALRREDFNNDRVDAGEVGAGHAVTAIYEVTPVGSPAVLHDALRYADRTAEPPVAGARPESARELAFLRLRYKEPGEDASELIELPIARGMGPASSDQRFAAAVAGFGQLLRGSVYTGGWTWADAIALAEANTGDDPFGYRREAVTLMRLAESLPR
ncbi:MAG: von Willebrand factor type A domain-containing protein [Acidobacteria bacterium]|nr:von Willebrand factor type A domain-containing protein [Acidobacteriota bacterium]